MSSLQRNWRCSATDKAANYLGLMRKAGRIALGEHDAGAAARAGKACLLLLAQDASDNARKRAEGFAHAAQAPLLHLPYTKQALSDRLGKTGCAHRGGHRSGSGEGLCVCAGAGESGAIQQHGGRACRTDENRHGHGADKRRAQWQEEETSMSGLIKYRVHEVAKDFNMTSKEITQILTDYATTPKNHMQVLEDDELNDIFEYLTQHHQAASLEELYKVPDQPKAKPQAGPGCAGQCAESRRRACKAAAADCPAAAAAAEAQEGRQAAPAASGGRAPRRRYPRCDDKPVQVRPAPG